jgi:hypothetical protein
MAPGDFYILDPELKWLRSNFSIGSKVNSVLTEWTKAHFSSSVQKEDLDSYINHSIWPHLKKMEFVHVGYRLSN